MDLFLYPLLPSIGCFICFFQYPDGFITMALQCNSWVGLYQCYILWRTYWSFFGGLLCMCVLLLVIWAFSLMVACHGEVMVRLPWLVWRLYRTLSFSWVKDSHSITRDAWPFKADCGCAILFPNTCVVQIRNAGFFFFLVLRSSFYSSWTLYLSYYCFISLSLFS